MARRSKTSPAEDLLNLIAMLPWWAGVALAAASYLLLSAVADKPVAVSTQGSQIGATLTSAIWKWMATAGQYLLPFVCLLGAGTSAYRRHQRRQLLNTAADSSASADVLDGMRWQEFEMLVAESFRRQGYQVLETGGGGADGGVDLVLRQSRTIGHETYLVQCKQWRALKVGVTVVRELYGVMAARGAAGGFVVTSGSFTTEARQFAQGRNLTLLDGPRLRQMIREANQSKGVKGARPAADVATEGHAAAAGSLKQPTTGSPMRPAGPMNPVADAGGAAEPGCPLCGKPMVRRTAKRGARAGQAFWGCSNYPDCRGTRSDGQPG